MAPPIVPDEGFNSLLDNGFRHSYLLLNAKR